MSLGEWLREAESRLAAAGIEDPRAEARLLAVHALGQTKAWVLTHGSEPLAPLGEGGRGEGRLDSWLERREQREPLAHLTGEREFYGRPFRVTPDTLIPRQDTETLVELALELAPKSAKVLDLGTGTGCIGITLALERPDLRVTLSDVSPAALAVARENAKTLNATVETIESDLYSALENPKPKTQNPKPPFDLIVSNPPYIRIEEPLMPEVAYYESGTALFAGEDGLDFYRRLATESGRYLNPGGVAVVEIGYDQSQSVPDLFQRDGWKQVAARQDLGGIVRALAFRRSLG